MVDGYSRITNKVYNIRTYVFDEIDYNDSQNHIEISSMSDTPYGKVRVSGYLGLLTYFIRILITVKTSMSSHGLSINYEVCVVHMLDVTSYLMDKKQTMSKL